MEPLRRTPEYEHLDELNPISGTVYGPFSSRRLGQVLGINLFSDQKICSFDCPYCELGRTNIRMNQLKKEIRFTPPEELIEKIRTDMRAARGLPLERIVISGNGEPTLYPHLSEIIDLIITAKEEILPTLPIVLMTNGAHIDTRKLVNALNRLDEVMIKVDAGNEAVFKQINNPLVRANLPKVIAGAHKLAHRSIQSFFVTGVIDNTQNAMIEDWIEVVGMMRPSKIYLYSLKRVPPIKGLVAADEDTLYTIASKLKRRTQIEALVFP